MRDKEYERAKEERARKDKTISMVVFSLMVLVLVGGITFIALNVP